MIEAVSDNSLEALLPLIRKYQELYKISKINDDKKQRVLFAVQRTWK